MENFEQKSKEEKIIGDVTPEEVAKLAEELGVDLKADMPEKGEVKELFGDSGETPMLDEDMPMAA